MKSLQERSRGRLALLLGLLGLAAALRLGNAALGSFKLDDFHSIHHARAPDIGSFFATLERDNHPPLSFLLVRASRALLGEGPWALRAPSLLAGLAGVLVVWRLSRRLPCLAGRIAATALLATSSLHIELSSDVRMYALLALATAGLLDGLLDLLEDGRGALRTALWTCVGLHTHYHFLYALGCLGPASAALLWSSNYRQRARHIALALALGILPALPWYALGFPAQLRHGLPPGGSEASLGRLLEGLVHLVFLNISVGGPWLRTVLLAAGCALLLLSFSGLLALWLLSARDRKAALPVLLGAGAFAAPLLASILAALVPRTGYEWRYLAGSLAPFAVLAGAEACARGPLARVRRATLGIACAGGLLLAVLNAADPGEEDYLGAVRAIAARIGPRDAVVAADWQPGLFPQGLAWEYYWPRVSGGRPAPRRLATRDYALASPDELEDVPRVFCCLRSLPRDCALLRALRRSFASEETRVFGRGIYVHVFSRADSGR